MAACILLTSLCAPCMMVAACILQQTCQGEPCRLSIASTQSPGLEPSRPCTRDAQVHTMHRGRSGGSAPHRSSKVPRLFLPLAVHTT
eukprot:1144119-Pelagomonas_calceolata.AAC.3